MLFFSYSSSFFFLYEPSGPSREMKGILGLLVTFSFCDKMFAKNNLGRKG